MEKKSIGILFVCLIVFSFFIGAIGLVSSSTNDVATVAATRGDAGVSPTATSADPKPGDSIKEWWEKNIIGGRP